MSYPFNNEKAGLEPIMIKTKVAIVRMPGTKQGFTAPCYLKCDCGAKPLTDIDTEADVKCECGTVYSYNGWIKEYRNSHN